MWRRVASLSPMFPSSKRISSCKAACGLNNWNTFASGMQTLVTDGVGSSLSTKSPYITFVLGGPGSGKGTQCAKIVQTFGFKHLSAGDLLRREISSNTENGALILNTIKEGKIVPSEVTVKLIQREIESSDNHKFLIDGFPRTEENRIAFERVIGMEPKFVLFFDCPKEEMVKRVMSRNQGRVDDNLDTMEKRLEVFSGLNLPVIDYYSKKGKVYKISAVGTEDEIFEKVCSIFTAFEESKV